MTPATIRVYEPAMCCSSGLCGPDVDPDLLRFSADVDSLERQGVVVERCNLAQQPAVFVAEPRVRQLLQEGGEAVLPVVLVGGEVKTSGRYPSRDLLAEWVGLGSGAGARDERVAELAAIARIEQHAERPLDKQAAPLPLAAAPSGCCSPASGAGATSASCC